MRSPSYLRIIEMSKDIIIDCGGAAFEWSDTYKELFPSISTIYIFEPCTHNYNFLKNGVCLANSGLILEKAAVGGQDGEATLYIAGQMHGTVYWGPTILSDKDTMWPSEIVKVVSLSRYWRENIDEDVSLLKMNVEGAEYHVFEDLLNAGIINRFKTIWYQDHGVRGEKVMPTCRDKGLEIYPRLRREYKGELKFITAMHPTTTFDVPEYLR